MRLYRASLDRLICMGDAFDRLLPGHGAAIERPLQFMRGLAAHRAMREAQVRDAIKMGPARPGDLVTALYPGLDPHLAGAARLSILAHLEELAERGDAVLHADGHFALA